MKKILFFTFLYLMTAFVTQAEGALDSLLSKRGYVDIETINPLILVRLMYARDDNFTGRLLYRPDVLTKGWLHPDAAKALGKAQEILSLEAPGTRLLVKDAARPMSVQAAMFNSVKGTPKANYVANPARGGGLHNFGLAVDITLADSEGRELPMGTPVDHLGEEANIDKEQQLVKDGVISETERQNRLLLRSVMRRAGFTTIRTEWWHFNYRTLSEAKSKYRLIDF